MKLSANHQGCLPHTLNIIISKATRWKNEDTKLLELKSLTSVSSKHLFSRTGSASDREKVKLSDDYAEILTYIQYNFKL